MITNNKSRYLNCALSLPGLILSFTTSCIQSVQIHIYMYIEYAVILCRHPPIVYNSFAVNQSAHTLVV